VFDPRALAARTHVGAARLERGDRAGAERALQRSLADARAHGALAVAAGALVFLARVHDGDAGAARAAIDEALDSFAAAGAQDANLAAHAWTHRGVLDAGAGDYDAAAEAAGGALAIQERRYGLNHPETANDLTNLGAALMAAGRPEEALGYHLRAIELVRDARKLNLAASCLDSLGRTTEARDLHAEAYELVRDLDAFDRGDAGAAMGWAAVAAREDDRAAVAEAYRLIADRMPPDAHPRWALRSRVEVARACERAGDVACAAERYRDALALDAGRDADPLHFDKARLYLGLLRKDDAPDEAASLFEGLLADGAEEAGVQELAATHLGWIRLDAGDAGEAAPLFQLAVDGFTRLVGADGASVFQARRNLACALMDLGRVDEARRHFQAAETALGPELGATPPRRDAILARSRASGAGGAE
jgi:tetratricopeptide (TPR) repeat protein